MNKVLDVGIPPGQGDTLHYLAQMAASLSQLAAKSEFDVLSFLFSMAQAEAAQLSSDIAAANRAPQRDGQNGPT